MGFVFQNASVTHLSVAEQPLHDQKHGLYGMFDTAKEEEYVLPGENCDILFLFRGSVV